MEPNRSPTSEPHALLAEDDAASLRFLADALASLGWRVTGVSNGLDALECARDQRFDLLLVDRRLPGLGALELLRELRADAGAASVDTPALASSAEWTRPLRDAARAAGYCDTLEKPISVAELGKLVGRVCRVPTRPQRDDSAALVAAGNVGNLRALRRLFVTELDRTAAQIASHGFTAPDWPDRLHRLCASAGFCGAPALGEAGRALLALLREQADAAPAQAAFVATLHATRTRFKAESDD